MSFGTSPTQYKGVQALNPPGVIRAARAPTTADLNHPFNSVWIDTATDDVYMYTQSSAGSANWTLLGQSSSSITDVAHGGTGLSTITDGAVMVGSGTAAVTPVGPGTTGQVLTGVTGSDPIWQSASASSESLSDVTLAQSPLLQSNANTGAAPVVTDTAVNLMSLQDDNLEVYNIGTKTIIAPRMDASGLLVSLDLTDDEGCEYNWGARNNAKHAFTIGTSPAFALEWNFTIADVTGADPIGIGFRKVEANNSTLESYTDFCWIGVSESDTTAVISLKTRLNSGSVTTTDTTDAWTDGETHRLKILVSASGVVTYTIDGSAPTVTAAFTFDDTDVVMPFFHLLHGATSPGAVHWVDYSCGPQ